MFSPASTAKSATLRFDCRFVTLVLAELDPRLHRVDNRQCAVICFRSLRRPTGRSNRSAGKESGKPLGIDCNEVYRSVALRSGAGRRRGSLLRRGARCARPAGSSYSANRDFVRRWLRRPGRGRGRRGDFGGGSRARRRDDHSLTTSLWSASAGMPSRFEGGMSERAQSSRMRE